MPDEKKFRTVFIVDGSRTPFLKAKGKRGPFTASDLAVATGKALLLRQPFSPEDFDEVIIGCVIPGIDETNIARIISLRLGCGKKVPAWTVHRNCASGLQALDCAFKNIAIGRANLVLAGGAEAMSYAPLLVDGKMQDWLADFSSRKGGFAGKLKILSRLRPGFFKPVIGLLHGLSDPIAGISMGQTAENLAFRFNITRKEADYFSEQSHKKLAAAQDEGRLEESEPVYDSKGHCYDSDGGLRRDTTVEKLAKLRPIFDKKVGLVTAGNSSQVTDGAALLILASEDAVKKYKLPVLGKIVDVNWNGVEPSEMGLGPVHAIAPLLERNNLKTGDIDFWEINEAFAAQVLGCLKAWNKDYLKEELGIKKFPGKIDIKKLNVDGGAISIGHPVGVSGARLVLHLLHVLKRTNTARGIASLCIGGGQGAAMLIERVKSKNASK